MFVLETLSRRYSHSRKQKNANYFAFCSFNRIFVAAATKSCDALEINRR